MEALRIQSDGSAHGDEMFRAVEKLVGTCQPANHEDSMTVERLAGEMNQLAADLKRLGWFTCVRPQTSVNHAVRKLEEYKAEVSYLNGRVLGLTDAVHALLDSLHERNIRVTPIEGVRVREIIEEYGLGR